MTVGVVGVIVQARMGSTRLPGKVMEDLGGKPCLYRVIDRAQRIPGVKRVILATTSKPEDNVLKQLAISSFCIPVYTGSEHDVLDRYYRTAEQHGLDTIIRITADCPLLDPILAGRVLARFKEGKYDYYSNCHPPTYPDGLDVEVFSADALAKAWTHGRDKDREHVTSYIWKRPHKFRMGNLVNSTDLSKLRWTLDTADDLVYIRKVYKALGNKPFSNAWMEDVLKLPFTHTLPRAIIL